MQGVVQNLFNFILVALISLMVSASLIILIMLVLDLAA